MKRDSVSGVLLIGAAVIGMAALTRHPSNLLSAGEGFARQANLAVWVHAVVIAATVVTFLGLLGLARRLATTPDLAVAGLVAYGFAVVAVTVAAAVSGFAGTSLAQRYLQADESTRHLLHEVFHYNSMVNQAFAKMHIVASSAALLLWSIAILRSRSLSRTVGVAGLLVGAGCLIGLMTGPVVLGVHAILLLALGQAVWMIWVGVEMVRRPTS